MMNHQQVVSAITIGDIADTIADFGFSIMFHDGMLE